MANTDPIYVDASHPADLRYRTNHPITLQCLSLQEAMLAFGRLAATDQPTATIAMRDGSGRVYRRGEIDRLHYGPKPE